MTYEQVAILSQAISAVLFIAVMVFMWIRYIQPAVLAAEERHNQDIGQTERHRDEAKASLDSLQGEIAAAQQDAEAIKARAQAQAGREHEEALAEATAAGERSVRNARGELDRSRAAARVRFRDELLSKALDAARSAASKKVDAAIDAGLVDAFLTNIERGTISR